MTPICLYMDEDMMSHSLVQALQARGVDVTTVLEQGREGISDLEQLRWATAQNRVICTANVADFVQLHVQFLETSELHCGILIISQQQYSVGQCLRGIMKFLSSKTPAEASQQIFFLSHFLKDV
jgi:predicted nuclease of predicted toxin-antitoxin system